ncbi:competence protein ComEA-like protein with helix-hairpin-helix repeat region [Spongiibacter sp. IMCC21906]|uniref:ComEA family DNA-binding protein n=1 Tax=Spongiibacter sp. IMCC21906 TaxID=1620392 RepID=UPI00062DD019|nr:helix-hairpin-helix domain-containing protein [Spongiibacter sp. IMCC21906]AKH68835.1 competence protein ComEA-like protein with helix-hairpin-helix repeat region [Spongiibacter sp. IMCC21906]
MKIAKPLWLMTSALFLFFALSFSNAFALDINTASSEQLQTLKGVGPKKAAAIVEYRDANGPFSSLESLTAVPGIGQKVIADNVSEIELSKPEGGSDTE